MRIGGAFHPAEPAVTDDKHFLFFRVIIPGDLLSVQILVEVAQFEIRQQ
jgi:hypothetical protein